VDKHQLRGDIRKISLHDHQTIGSDHISCADNNSRINELTPGNIKSIMSGVSFVHLMSKKGIFQQFSDRAIQGEVDQENNQLKSQFPSQHSFF
jgi:hypothetical protein